MASEQRNHDLVERLLAEWPLAAWDGVHVLAAVSGGADSMAMLRALVAAKAGGGGAGRVIAGHVNHQLRGRDSDADEAWLRAECERLGLPLTVRRADARATAAAAGDGIEAAAREERYRQLAEMAQESGARFVATAHTRDDQAETVLFRLLRGSGLRGLAGMRRVRPLSPSVTLVRPLLACTRAELRAYLTQLGQAFREDATNADFAFARNRVRGEALPYLREQFNADVDAALVRTAQMAGEAHELIESLAAELFGRSAREISPGVVVLDVQSLAGQRPMLVVEALRAAWRAAGWPEQAMTHAWWRQLAELALSVGDVPAINLPGNVLARRTGGLLEMRGAGV